jgi:hypothetical protein
MKIETFDHGARLALHLGRMTGQRFALGVTLRPAEDAATLLQQIDAMKDHIHLQTSEDGQALLAFGELLREELAPRKDKKA